MRDFLSRVNNPDRKINVFTVGVGDYKQPVEIKIDEIQSPQSVRPDEKFPIGRCRSSPRAKAAERRESPKVILEARFRPRTN